MQAIILAAGMGRRLGPLTRENTKCMIEVNGVRLIDRLLTQLSALNLTRVVMVTGYEGGKLRSYVGESYRGMPIEYIDNPIYDRTNNIYSLSLAREQLQEDDTLLIESDLIFEDSLFRLILDSPHPNAALVDKYKSWMDGTMVRLDAENNIVNFIPKKAFKYSDTDSYYKTVNIYKFSRDFSVNHYVPFLEAYTRALGNNEYYEQVLRVITLIDACDFKALPLDGQKWYEIDDVQDLRIAETLFADAEDKLLKYQRCYGGYWRFPALLDFCYLVNPYFPPQRMVEELKANFETLLREYPSGMGVNSLLGAKYFGLSQPYVCVGNGAAELIKSLMGSIEGPVGVVYPTFEEYPNRRSADGVVPYVPQNPDFAYTADDLMRKATSSANGFRMYTRSDYRAAAQQTVNSYEDKGQLELQFLDTAGAVLYSGNDLTAGSTPNTPDIQKALNERTASPWKGRDPATGERILAASSPVIYQGEIVGVIRYVTSLSSIDRQFIFAMTVITAIALGIFAMVYFSNLYFVRSIVEPLAGITEIAQVIADGSYGVQIEKKYDDEIGELTDAINNMSLKIRQAERTQSEFISSVSHELRTPLTAITGWAETIQSGELRSEADIRKGMGIIVSEAKRLSNMVEELLEFSRIEDGRFTLSVEPLDLKAELEDAVYTYTEFFRKEGITLEYTDGPEEELPISGDPERLRQVFCNLLDNAAKHGGAGKRIHVTLFQEGAEAVIRIRDYGPGAPEEELPYLKNKFYKGSSKARGSGIGLAVCEEIVTRHEGRMDVGNAEGGGFLVTIRLPLEN